MDAFKSSEEITDFIRFMVQAGASLEDLSNRAETLDPETRLDGFMKIMANTALWVHLFEPIFTTILTKTEIEWINEKDYYLLLREGSL